MSFDSTAYWENRYATGGNSGAGSYGLIADFKANSLNNFIRENGIESAIEYGSGDGNQLSLLKINEYLGLDVSTTTIENLRKKFATDSSKSFVAYNGDSFEVDVTFKRDIALSMDVILHLTEDSRYEKYMSNLVKSSHRYLGIFTTATEKQPEKMARHNRFRDHRFWLNENAPSWKEIRVDFTPAELGYPETTGFYYYEKIGE